MRMSAIRERGGKCGGGAGARARRDRPNAPQHDALSPISMRSVPRIRLCAKKVGSVRKYSSSPAAALAAAPAAPPRPGARSVR